MRVDENIRKNVVFVGIETDRGFVPTGTGVFGGTDYSGLTCVFLITAKHVIERFHKDFREFSVRVNRKSGGCEIIKIPRDKGIYHQNADIDLVLFPVSPDFNVFDIFIVPLDLSRWKIGLDHVTDIGCGDEVAVVGLYTSHYGMTKNVPVVRVGNIALMPGEPVFVGGAYVSAYLIEVKSIAGLSGSPVYLNVGRFRHYEGQARLWDGHTYLMIGLLVGYHVVETKQDQIAVPEYQGEDLNDDVINKSVDERNTGFAVVIPMERIFEIVQYQDTQEIIKTAIHIRLGEMYRGSLGFNGNQ